MASAASAPSGSTKKHTIGGLSFDVHDQLKKYKKAGNFSSFNDALADLLNRAKGRKVKKKGSSEAPPLKKARKKPVKGRKKTTFFHGGWDFESIASLPTYFRAVTGCDVELARAMPRLLQNAVRASQFFFPLSSLPQ